MLVETTPIPVKFDRQGHSCNLYGGFGPTVFELCQSSSSSCVRFLPKLACDVAAVLVASAWPSGLSMKVCAPHYGTIAYMVSVTWQSQHGPFRTSFLVKASFRHTHIYLLGLLAMIKDRRSKR